jgi:hypothetical protein
MLHFRRRSHRSDPEPVRSEELSNKLAQLTVIIDHENMRVGRSCEDIGWRQSLFGMGMLDHGRSRSAEESRQAFKLPADRRFL